MKNMTLFLPLDMKKLWSDDDTIVTLIGNYITFLGKLFLD